MNKTLQSTICLFSAAIIWGSAFVAQRSGMDSIGPFYFCALRSLIGSLALVIVFLLTDRKASLHRAADADDPSAKPALEKERQRERKTLIRGGLICGCVIFIAMNTQQIGLVSTDAGKTGFITALYIVLVPIFGIFLKHKTGITTWMGALLGAVGLYFLCVKDGFSIQPSDLIILSGTLFWALHILCVGHFAPKVNVIKLTASQFFVAGVISLIVAVFREPISWDALTGSGIAVLYTGVMSTGVAFTLQALGQKHANPTAASIIMSTEGLWAVVFGFLILGEKMTERELIGCAFMLVAVVISQLPVPTKKSKPEETQEENPEEGIEKEVNPYE